MEKGGFNDVFGNESEVLWIGDMTLENRVDRISVYGSFSLTRDKEGLRLAEAMRDVLNEIIAKMNSAELPEQVEIESPTEGLSPL